MYIAVNVIWILLGTILVFSMQAGFTMLETGFTRAKNAGNIMMKNLMDFCIGTLVYFIFGFSLMYAMGNGFIGSISLGLSGEYDDILPNGIPLNAYFMFQTVFCATSATVVSGAVAGRTKFSTYCIISTIVSGFIYPISGHWIWGGGWLAKLGFHDFAGSTAVHLLGGMIGLVAAVIIGPRIGKYDKKGKSIPIAGHNIPIGTLGVFLLWIGWFGFNACSTLTIDDNASMETAAKIFLTTNLAASAAAVSSMFTTWFRYGKPEISMTLNGVLAGLVAITAGCDVVSPVGAIIIGVTAGVLVVFSIEFLDYKGKVDDPVGAVSVHGISGALGTILTGVFAIEGGLFYGGGMKMFFVQILGVISVTAWGIGTTVVLLLFLKSTMGLRSSTAEEQAGMDISEHGLQSAYPDFVSTAPFSGYTPELLENEKAAIDKAIPVEILTDVDHIDDSSSPITKIEILTKPQRFEALKTAMNEIGVTGMTVTQVSGFGMQKGLSEYYRGVEMNMQLLPKIKVEIIVAKVPAEQVVNVAKKVLYTGHIGDGKIFIYEVKNVLRVRTGEYGYNAMQGVDE